MRLALEAFAADGDAAKALAKLPARGCGLARRLLSTHADAAASSEAGAASGGGVVSTPAAHALRTLPRRQLLLYLNALQALAFNRAATRRLTCLHGERAVEGDLVWADASQQHASAEGDAAAEDAMEDAEEAVDEAGAADATRAALPPAARALSAEEAASGKYTLSDVLLPLPGHAVVYPQHEAAGEYDRVLSELGVAPAEQLWYEPGLFDLPGCYRPLIAHPQDLSGRVMPYADHTTQLEPSDLDALEPRESAAAPGTTIRTHRLGAIRVGAALLPAAVELRDHVRARGDARADRAERRTRRGQEGGAR